MAWRGIRSGEAPHPMTWWGRVRMEARMRSDWLHRYLTVVFPLQTAPLQQTVALSAYVSRNGSVDLGGGEIRNA